MSILMVYVFLHIHTSIYIYMKTVNPALWYQWLVSPIACPTSTETAPPQHTDSQFRISIFFTSGGSECYHSGESESDGLCGCDRLQEEEARYSIYIHASTPQFRTDSVLNSSIFKGRQIPGVQVPSLPQRWQIIRQKRAKERQRMPYRMIGDLQKLRETN